MQSLSKRVKEEAAPPTKSPKPDAPAKKPKGEKKKKKAKAEPVASKGKDDDKQ